MAIARSIAGLMKNALYPKGSAATIRVGPLAGFRYVVSDNSGWSPILGRKEIGAQQLYSLVIEAGQTVYDLGANIGLHTLLFAKLAGASGRVVAFEPLPENIREIEQNFAMNSLHNLTVVDMAVGRSSGTATFVMGENNAQGSLADGQAIGGTRLTVAVTSLDDFTRGSAPAPDFIKVDIEGAEGPALLGGLETLKRHWPILSVELHTPEQDVLVGTTLDDLGYRLYRFNPDSRSRPELVRVRAPREGWPNQQGTWGTVLAVPPSRRERLRKLGLGADG